MGKLIDQIRKAIEDSDMTRSAISKASGVPESTLSRFIHGEREFGLTVLEKLAPVLGLTITTRKPKKALDYPSDRPEKGKASPGQTARTQRKRKAR